MTTSDQINEIASDLAMAQGEMTGAAKDAANPFFKSKYATLSSVMEACRGPLTKHGIAILQSPSVEGTRVSLETRLLHASGQWIAGVVSASAKDDAPQSIGSTISYLRRYAIQSFVCVSYEDDDDGEAATGRSRGYVVEAPREARSPDGDGPNQHVQRGVLPSAARQAGSEPAAPLSPTGVVITHVDVVTGGKIKGYLHHSGQPVSLRGREGLAMYDEREVALAEQLCQTREPVRLDLKVSETSNKPYVKKIHRVPANEVPKPVAEGELTADAIPF